MLTHPTSPNHASNEGAEMAERDAIRKITIALLNLGRVGIAVRWTMQFAPLLLTLGLGLRFGTGCADLIGRQFLPGREPLIHQVIPPFHRSADVFEVW